MCLQHCAWNEEIQSIWKYFLGKSNQNIGAQKFQEIQTIWISRKCIFFLDLLDHQKILTIIIIVDHFEITSKNEVDKNFRPLENSTYVYQLKFGAQHLWISLLKKGAQHLWIWWWRKVHNVYEFLGEERCTMFMNSTFPFKSTYYYKMYNVVYRWWANMF